MNPKTALKQLRILGKNQKEMRLAAESWSSPFQILISTIMSARTRDEVTIPIAEKLFRKYPDSKKLAKSKLSEIQKIIRPVNFYKNKSKNIIECSKQIVKDYDSKVPLNFEELIKLRGVGRKTANVFLSEVGHKTIGVDTHVSYISQKLGWTKHKNPHKIEKDLKSLFPKKHWNRINETLVRFGKTHTSRKEKDKKLEEIGRVR
ncbi:endonuclease III [Candidatus Pacearchaeota archaeon]|nr:endonuclease III [Candidatus Pacearchaeota archaeon]